MAQVDNEVVTMTAQRYYGDASKYHKIFEANRNQLHDPDKIKSVRS